MTGTHDKLKSLFLTTLMVLSVFAGTVAMTGTVAAASSANFDNGGAQASQYSQLESTAHVDDDGGSSFSEVSVSFEGAFDGSFNDVTSSDVVVYVYNDQSQIGTGNFKARYQNDATVASSTDSSITVQLSSSQNVEADDYVRVDIQEGFLNPSSGDYAGNIDIGNDGSNLAEGTLSIAGDGGETDDPLTTEEKRDAYWDSGATRWKGQMLYFSNLTDTDSGAENQGDFSVVRYDAGTVTPQGAPVTSFNPGGDDQILLDSSNFPAGEDLAIVLDGQGVCVNNQGHYTGTANAQGICADNSPASLYLAKQNLSTVAWTDSTVSAGASETLNIGSNRATYTVEIGADGLSESQLADMFGEDDSDGDGTVAVPIDSNDADLNADFEGVSTGEYEFTVEVTDTGASGTATITVGEAAGLQADFARSSFSEERGDVATISLDLQQTESVVVTIGGDEANFEESVRLEDSDADGNVSVMVNTYWVGRTADDNVAGPYTAGPGTDIGFVDREVGVNSPLEQFSYSLSARVGNTQTDQGVLRLNERNLNGITLQTAAGALNPSDAEELANNSYGADGEVAKGDLAVMRVDGSGLYGYATNQSTWERTTEGDGEELHPVSLHIVEGGETVNAQATTVPNASQYINVYPDADNNDLYVTLDTTAMTSDGTEMSAGSTYNVSFAVTDSNPLVDSSETVYAEFTVVERTVTFDKRNGQVAVEAAANQSITGSTTAAPGTTFTVFAESSDETPMFKTDSVTVQQDGTFAAEFDFTNATQNETFTVRVDNGGFGETTAQGVVQPKPTASVTFNDQTTSGEQVVVASATLSEGGFIAIHNSAGDIIGTSSYLSAGSHSDVTVTLDSAISEDQTLTAMAHLDSNGNQAFDSGTDSPYTQNGSAVTDDASVTVSTATPTPTPTPTASPTPTDSPEPEGPTPTDTPSGPGFGIVASVLALLGAALLATRRS